MKTAPCVALLALLAPASASAQPWSPDVLQAHFRECVGHDDRQRRAEAVDCWRSVRTHSDALQVVYNFALALQTSGRYREATHEFRRYLERVTESTETRQYVRHAREAIDDMSLGMGRLSILTTPAEACVTIDDEPIPRTEDPIMLDPGVRHTLLVEAPDHAAVTRTITVHGGLRERRDITLTPVSVVGRLHLDASPAEAAIEVDEQIVGHGRVDEPLRMGPHHVRVTALGHRAFERTVDIPRGEAVRLRVELSDERPLTARTWFRVTVGVAAVAIVAGAIVGGVILLSRDADPYPYALFNVPPM